MKRFYIALAVVAVALVGVIVWRVTQPADEPVHEGKRLSVWLEGYDTANNPHVPPETHDGPLPPRVMPVYSLQVVSWITVPNPALPHAEEAVRQLGSKVVPTLVAMIAASDPPLKAKLKDLLERQHFISFHFTRAHQLHVRAYSAFKTLGPAGASAFPGLGKLFRSPDSEVRGYAIEAIHSIWTGLNQELLVPTLTNALSDPDINVRFAAIGTLRNVKLENPEPYLPFLIAQLGCTNAWEFSRVCDVLTSLRPQAKTAVPALVKQLARQPAERAAALNALNAIDPEAAAKAGITNAP
jgi:hypothetical protein